jgi:8-oxo-dGTP pyrophosphatase MutT (NUDIX family)
MAAPGRRAVVAALLRAAGDTGECQILYIKRKAYESDRWGGQWAFPGGKGEPNETLEETCAREVMEEIGIDLTNPAKWHPLGFISRRLASENFYVHLAAFLQLTHGTAQDLDDARICLQGSEVAAGIWIPSRFFRESSPTAYRHPKFPFYFPSYHLPVPKDIILEPPHVPLWGLTLALTQDLFRWAATSLPPLEEWDPLEPRSLSPPIDPLS